MIELSYRRHRFLPVVIQNAVWLYLRFTLSYRGIEDLLAERGLDISYETVRSWVLKFGPVPGSAPARQPSRVAADAQASQEARICAEVAGHRQAALLRLGIPASTTDRSS